MNKLHLLTILFLLFKQLTFAQKITIVFDSAPSSIPTVSKAPLKYNKDFAYSFTLDDATIDAYTCALPMLKGGTIKDIGVTYPGFFYTDGCGNDIGFKCGIAWNSANLSDIDTHTGEVQNILTWKQLDTLYDLGWDVFNHSYSHKSRWVLNMTPSDYSNEITKNQASVSAKTAKKIDLPVFVVPSGDDMYQDYALQLGSKVVFDQSGQVTGFAGLQVDGDIPLTGQRIHRQLFEEGLGYNAFERAYNKTLNGGHYWYNEFTHRIDDYASQGFYFYSFKNQMQKVADNWGKNGKDNVWMAPLQEVYEYLVIRQAVTFGVNISNNRLDIKFDISKMPTWMRRKTLTLVLNTNNTFSKVETTNGLKTTFNGTSQNKIINIDFSNFTTSIQEQSPSLVRLYPNPTGDILNIDLLEKDKTTDITYTISDISGRAVQTSQLKALPYPINIQHLSKGTYIITLRQGERQYSSKFVKE